MPSPVRYAAVKRLLERHGWAHTRTSGSHHIFTKPGDRLWSVPVHNGTVKHAYVRQIKQYVGGEG
jgi:predicted RNA binding protein YcfA (HicA-like mRNA interferase family)